MTIEAMRKIVSDTPPALTRTKDGIFVVTYNRGQAYYQPLHTTLRVFLTNEADGGQVFEISPELAQRIVMSVAPSEHNANEYPLWYAEDWA